MSNAEEHVLRTQISGWIQYPVIVALVGAALVVYYKRDAVYGLFFQEKAGEKAAVRRSGKRKREALPVIVRKVTTGGHDTVVEAIGDGRATRFVTLYAKAPGEIVFFPVKTGQRLTKGQIVLELDSRKVKLAVEIARTRLVEAERKMARTKKLRQQNVSSQANVDDAVTSLNRAKLELLQAKEALNDRIVRAPFEGVVGIPKVEAGDTVGTTTGIVTLDDRSALVVEFDVPEQHYTQVSAGQEIEARTPGYPGQVFKGFIREVDSRVDTLSRAVKVRAEIPNGKDMLRPGMSFSVKLVVKGESYPVIPELALQWSKGESFVWVVEKGKAKRTQVTIIRRRNSNILVNGKLSEGDQVVIEGVQRLRPGARLKFTGGKAVREQVGRDE